MFENYLQIDNAFEDPFNVREKLLQLPYYTKENFAFPGLNIVNDNGIPKGDWRGFRTQNMFLTMPKRSKTMMDNLLVKIFGNFKFDYYGQTYGHIATEKMTKEIPTEKRWHKDQFEQFAGVIYLNENPSPNSGTYLFLNDGVIQVENIFNRLVIYRSEIVHRPGEFFGNEARNSRLTFTFFLRHFKIY